MKARTYRIVPPPAMIPVLIASFASIASIQAVTVTAHVTGSSSGFGDISYNPGTNVSEFIIYGKASAGDDYITSTTSTHIVKEITGDGDASGYDQTYTATTFSWTDGTPVSSASGYNTESFQAVGDAWGGTPYTTAAIAITCPAADFTFSFLVHDYYVSTDLEVRLGNSLVGSYADVMRSSYNIGGGEERNTDYYYEFNVTGATAGQAMEFKFTNMANLGSSWSNIAFLSAGLNYDTPETITNTYNTMPNVVPEPRAALIGGLGMLSLLRRRRG